MFQDAILKLSLSRLANGQRTPNIRRIRWQFVGFQLVRSSAFSGNGSIRLTQLDLDYTLWRITLSVNSLRLFLNLDFRDGLTVVFILTESLKV